ncbi:M14 family metallocarboxypeptidase [Rossellomorea sp. YZS02]|uniref:M14 family metallopeptidase n=1 Tax=Rossellomorea sp. YZS02 TaxID=3097358 RepID=UPI002A0CD5C7|nr:M14 family metallocarboxypeptidase [Rossellomorea sp. YZS02]MDX8344131.1 M14 family metallocarboxypeptidase [Rossellomorea sp. YZS02]
MKRVLILFLFLFIYLSATAFADDSGMYVKTVISTELVTPEKTVTVETGTILEVTSRSGDKTYIRWNDLEGYVPSSAVTGVTDWEAHPDIKRFVTTTDAPLFYKEGNAFVKKARLLKGEVFEGGGKEGDYHLIKLGTHTAYIRLNDTSPLLTGNLPSGVAEGKPHKRFRVVSHYTATLYYEKDGKLTAFSRIVPGVKLPLLAQHENFFIVEIGGRKAYVKNSDVSVYTGDYVNPHKTYTYEQMVTDLVELQLWYPEFASLERIGTSVDGRYLYAFRLGTGKEEILVDASHHAREHLTTNLVMEMIDKYSYAYQQNQKIGGYSIRDLLSQTTIWFVPMVNPDGVTLVQRGHSSAKNPAQVLRLNNGKTDFSAWKANIRGVDLNRQYPADWENICCNPGKPDPQNYKGTKPLTEPEARALYDFTNAHTFKGALTYHSSGEILYWYFHQDAKRKARDLAIAKKISHKTGYRLVKPTKNPSGGGFSDWFTISQKKPGFTPEISPYVGNKPVPVSSFDSIWRENYTVPLLLANEKID